MIRITQKIHRVLGLVGVVFILLLTFTGVLLNHSEDLELYEVYPESPLVLWLYGGGGGDPIDSSISSDDWGGEPPSWEKVLTAFHGGKFFGLESNIFLDFLAIIVLTIALTGPYLWYLKARSNLLNLQTGQSSEEEGELLDLLASLKTIQALHAKTTTFRESLKSAMEKDKETKSPEMLDQLSKLDTKLFNIHSNLDGLIDRIGKLGNQ